MYDITLLGCGDFVNLNLPLFECLSFGLPSWTGGLRRWRGDGESVRELKEVVDIEKEWAAVEDGGLWEKISPGGELLDC